ncbi:MAG: PAS domain-containing protein [Treponema sp.]|nr:PAS domain-containing protein [Treponema sp.]
MRPRKSAEQTVDTPLYYVAVGASAGGLEAIDEFFTNMPTDTGLAFIVIQHLSPDYKSLMVELLSKKTSMPVQRAEDGLQVLPNRVYLIPPRKNLTIFHGKLLLSEQDHSRGINLPIDIFLTSLAEDQAEKAIAVILSGTGSDGMRGVRKVKENGGMVMVQDEDSAKFNGMPRAAISTGLPDFILKPSDMPRQLLGFIARPYASLSARSETLLSEEDGLTRIFALLRERCKVDFTYYKPNTVTRRIERRMTVTQSNTIGDYVAYLNGNPLEISALFRELLIGVTSFFRDPPAWERLASKELPELIRAAEGRELRFWVAACSTGEEAYSLAISAREVMEELGIRRDVKIFATDIDKDAIHFAAAGVYPESVAADLSPRYLAKYFFKKEDSFQISRAVREMVVFAQHNLIKDPPFTNIDLISCRNILIYLQPNLQRKVLDYFNFSLLPGGILFLGTSETAGEAAEYFDLADAKNKIYRSAGRSRTPLEPPQGPSVTDTRAREIRDRFASARRYYRSHEEDRTLERFLESITPDYVPLAIIVNELMEPLHILGDTNGFFRLPSGRPTADITRMAVKELSIPLSTGIQKVFRQGQELKFSNLHIPSLGKTIELKIRLLPAKKSQEPLAAVLISETRKESAPDRVGTVVDYDLSKETEQRIRDLEQELQFTGENLQATIEELETANEELQATNEELLASNEELQSTNEELQSTNEELFTVNAEYHTKILELTELHNDLENLLSSSHIGHLILDENLEIRRFSSQISNIFKLLEADMGRPITHIPHYLTGVDPVEIIREVQRNSREHIQEVRTSDGRWFLMRVLPYSVGPGAFSGTVLSFTETTEVRQALTALMDSERRFAAIVDNSPALKWMSGADKKCFWFNRTWLDFTGRTLEQELGDGWTEGVHPEDRDRCFSEYSAAFDARRPFTLRYRLRRRDGAYRLLEDVGTPRYDEDGTFLGYVGTCLDIQELEDLKAALAAAEDRIRLLESARPSSTGG